jgi:hypothetical protein
VASPGLLGAYRAGAVVAWRHVADEALRAAVPTEMFAALGAAVFAAVDQLSAATLDGYPDSAPFLPAIASPGSAS